MRITEQTRFPHPVLSQDTADFESGAFEISFTGVETPSTGALTLEHMITLTQVSVLDLVRKGEASIGCFVRCPDTYFTDLLRLSWPSGRSDFVAGTLLNKVTLQPLIWLEKDMVGWDPGTIHPEFDPPVDLRHGEVIAIGSEHVMSVGQAKFSALESIFELRRSSETTDGRISIDIEGDRIGIVAGQSTFDAIALLRAQAGGQPVVMNAIYLPAVMEVLDVLRAGPQGYDAYRWYQPFVARCDVKGIDPTGGASILENAQNLLDAPIRTLSLLVSDGDT